MKFPVHEIEAHADICAEFSMRVPSPRRAYDDLMMDSVENVFLTEDSGSASDVPEVVDAFSDSKMADTKDNDSLEVFGTSW